MAFYAGTVDLHLDQVTNVNRSWQVAIQMVHANLEASSHSLIQ